MTTCQECNALQAKREHSQRIYLDALDQVNESGISVERSMTLCLAVMRSRLDWAEAQDQFEKHRARHPVEAEEAQPAADAGFARSTFAG